MAGYRKALIVTGGSFLILFTAGALWLRNTEVGKAAAGLNAAKKAYAMAGLPVTPQDAEKLWRVPDYENAANLYVNLVKKQTYKKVLSAISQKFQSKQANGRFVMALDPGLKSRLEELLAQIKTFENLKYLRGEHDWSQIHTIIYTESVHLYSVNAGAVYLADLEFEKGDHDRAFSYIDTAIATARWAEVPRPAARANLSMEVIKTLAGWLVKRPQDAKLLNLMKPRIDTLAKPYDLEFFIKMEAYGLAKSIQLMKLPPEKLLYDLDWIYPSSRPEIKFRSRLPFYLDAQEARCHEVALAKWNGYRANMAKQTQAAALSDAESKITTVASLGEDSMYLADMMSHFTNSESRFVGKERSYLGVLMQAHAAAEARTRDGQFPKLLAGSREFTTCFPSLKPLGVSVGKDSYTVTYNGSTREDNFEIKLKTK